MNHISEHLKSRLHSCSEYILSETEKNEIKKNGIESYILKKLSTKKYRKWKMDPHCLERTKKAIHIAVKENKPIHAVYFLGGYKLWHLPSSPEVDWAEFFNIAYLLEYLAPIAAVYKPGVILSYFTHTLLMEKHDNLDTQEINTYLNSFQTLINAFLKYIPLNMTIRIWRDADLYGRDEYYKALEDGIALAKEKYEALSPEQQLHYQKLGALNIKWSGKQNWSTLNEEEKQRKILQGIYYELSATSVLKRLQFTAKGEDKVCLFTKSSPLFIGIGSTKNSVVKHWTGFGVLEMRKEAYEERILSPSQLDKVKNIPHETYPVNILPISNLNEIWVFKNPLEFQSK